MKDAARLARSGFLAGLLLATLSACNELDSDNERAGAPEGGGITDTEPTVTVMATGLEHPWGLTFLSPSELLVTERPGRLRRVDLEQPLSERVGPAISGLPEIAAAGQGGLLDVTHDDEWVYLSFSEPSVAGTNSTAVLRARLQNNALSDQSVIFSQRPKVASAAHFGSRLVLAPNNLLYVTLGDRYSEMADAQTLDNHHGKIVRIGRDGSVPSDNPFVNTPGALPEIWSFGHRNVQGATLHPQTGELWTHEHGPRGGDEINRIEAGANYGWPVITYGIDYSGVPIGEGTQREGMEQPLYYWDPSIAPSGMTFYRHNACPQWQQSLWVGALKFRQLVQLTTDGLAISAEQRWLGDSVGARIRAVTVGPDGALYLLTDEDNGQLLRVSCR